MPPRGAKIASWRPPGGLLGVRSAPGGRPDRSWAALGAFLVALGAVLGRSWRLLGPSWASQGGPRRLPGGPWEAILGGILGGQVREPKKVENSR